MLLPWVLVPLRFRQAFSELPWFVRVRSAWFPFHSMVRTWSFHQYGSGIPGESSFSTYSWLPSSFLQSLLLYWNRATSPSDFVYKNCPYSKSWWWLYFWSWPPFLYCQSVVRHPIPVTGYWKHPDELFLSRQTGQQSKVSDVWLLSADRLHHNLRIPEALRLNGKHCAFPDTRSCRYESSSFRHRTRILPMPSPVRSYLHRWFRGKWTSQSDVSDPVIRHDYGARHLPRLQSLHPDRLHVDEVPLPGAIVYPFHFAASCWQEYLSNGKQHRQCPQHLPLP